MVAIRLHLSTTTDRGADATCQRNDLGVIICALRLRMGIRAQGKIVVDIAEDMFSHHGRRGGHAQDKLCHYVHHRACSGMSVSGTFASCETLIKAPRRIEPKMR